LPRAFFLFLVEVETPAPFLCLALVPFGRPDSANRSSHFNLVFDTPNSFAVSSAVAKVEFSVTVISILSSYYTLLYLKNLGSFLMIPPGFVPYPPQNPVATPSIV
jgi:hypothetical protein